MKKVVCGLLCFTLFMVVLLNCNQTISVNAYSGEIFDNFTSDSYVLLDSDSGTILVSKNAEEKLPVASICKLMTSLITLEKLDSGALDLNTQVLASEHACSMEGSQAFLDAGSSYSVSELLKSVVVASANDSAVALSEAISGSESAFVLEMNKRAKELGMNNTIYANATGLPAPNQHSTAMDTSIILKEIAKHDLYVKYSNIWMDTFTHPSGRQTELVNTNRLIKYYSNCKTGKTGFTDEAGYCLASSASNGNLNLIAVTLKCDKAQDRFKESMDLYNYGFANFENKKLIDSSVPLTEQIKVSGGKVNYANCKFKNDFSVVTKKGTNKKYDIKIDLINSVKAPQTLGSKVGNATIVKDGKVVGEVEIVLADNLEKQGFKDILNKMAKNWAIN
ncbi:MAG: D-alanyl-D-alanine carboxypeptidase [Clostridia bacterium]|nr:D-alanyl-D-alanine carboxypeptidase [Clostridia bacterium]